ncbi:MAG: hypothetical protein AAFU74_01155 [Bacteroidota bacterium]
MKRKIALLLLLAAMPMALSAQDRLKTKTQDYSFMDAKFVYYEQEANEPLWRFYQRTNAFMEKEIQDGWHTVDFQMEKENIDIGGQPQTKRTMIVLFNKEITGRAKVKINKAGEIVSSRDLTKN